MQRTPTFRCPWPVIFSMMLLFMTGCGAMFGGTTQLIRVDSSPPGAKIRTSPPSGEYSTPASMSLERKSNYTLTFEKEGYSPAKFEIQHRLRGGIVALDVLAGLLGVVVDAATGAWYKLVPDVVNVSLTKVGLIDGPEKIDIRVEIAQGQTRQSDVLRVTSSEPGIVIHVQPRRDR